VSGAAVVHAHVKQRTVDGSNNRGLRREVNDARNGTMATRGSSKRSKQSVGHIGLDDLQATLVAALSQIGAPSAAEIIYDDHTHAAREKLVDGV
jgi:hypothetical protein